MNTPARITAWIGFGYLILGWAAVITIDVLNVFDAQNWLTAGLNPLPLLWYELFSEASPAEMLQWAALAVSFIVFATVALQLRKQSDWHRYRFAAMLSLGLLLMLIEDFLNLRHVVVDHYFPLVFGEPSTYPRRTYRLIWELIFYTFLSVLMVIPFVVFWLKGVWHGTGLRILTVAYLIYGFAGFSSALRRVGDWQERLGYWLIERLNLAELPAWAESLSRMERWRELSSGYTHTLGYLLTDHLIEESIELIAATLLVTALLSLRQQTLSYTPVNRA